MADSARRLATYDDVVAAGDARVEVIAGVLESRPSPRPRQSKVQGALRTRLAPFDDDDGHGGPGGWWILLELDVRFDRHTIVRPDLAGWKRTRLTDMDSVPVDVRPDWVCEILSPTSHRRDLVTKRNLYAKHGVPHYWVVDVEARTLEALTLVDERWRIDGTWSDEDTARIAPFDAIELAIGRLFPPPGPPRT